MFVIISVCVNKNTFILCSESEILTLIKKDYRNIKLEENLFGQKCSFVRIYIKYYIHFEQLFSI